MRTDAHQKVKPTHLKRAAFLYVRQSTLRQVFENVEIALQSVGAGWSNVVHFTNYLVNPEDQPRLVKFRLEFFPGAFPNGYPPNTLLYVPRLLNPKFLVEVQAIAVL